MAHHTYQVEAWKQGEMVFRTEESDSYDQTMRKADILYETLGITWTVFLLRDGCEQFLQYEWHALSE